MLVKKEIELSKESSELAEAVVKLIKSGKVALADGFQAGQDIPVILGENLVGLMSGLEGMEKISGEQKENFEAFLKVWALAGAELAALFLVKEEK